MTMQTSQSESFTFYSMAISSFLESAVPEYVRNLQLLCSTDRELVAWLQNIWEPDERRHGELTAAYVRKTWPQFSWSSAYSDFMTLIPKQDISHLNSSFGLEMLSRCVTETEAAMMYRCLCSYTIDGALKNIMHRLSTDEIRHYNMFRKTFRRQQAVEKNNAVEIVQTIQCRSKTILARDVSLAFKSLNHHWREEAPFALMDYAEFLEVTRQIVSVHLPVEETKRMLLKPLDEVKWFRSSAKWIAGKLLDKQLAIFGVEPV